MVSARYSLPPRYRQVELIAHGGMGDVWRATDGALGRVVAVKVLAERLAESDEYRERFTREGRTAARLSGEPYVVAIHDVGDAQGLPYIVMEYVPGGSLADRLRDGTPPTAQALAWLEQTAEALDRAHEHGIVHRDVKPANLLVAENGTVRVTDFGVARMVEQDTLTQVGSIIGTTGYMAPEQATGGEVTAASDRYALACVAFELLSGKRPFERSSPTAEVAAHVNLPPPSVRGVRAELPPALDAVFARALAKEPEARPPSSCALVADLRGALAEPLPADERIGTTIVRPAPVVSPRGASVPVTRQKTRRLGLALAAALLLALAGFGLALGLAGLGDDPRVAERTVVTETIRGKTQVQTVTVDVTETLEVTQPSEEPPASESQPPAGRSGVALNDEGFRLLQARNPDAALPLLEQAVAQLRGENSLTEAYASYNLAVARFSLGNCEGVIELLDHSVELQGARKEIDRLRRNVERRCERDND